jgi:vacuolar-type H+-ATPase subunit I/STV1
MPRTSLIRPPIIAAWLVDLLTPYEQAESIPGDLLEEFSDLVSKSGVAIARRWYWRQSVKTIGHLIGIGFRVAPWSIVGTVLGGYLLLAFGASRSWVEDAIVGVIQFRRHHVTPYYSNLEMENHVFWLNTSIFIGHLLMSLLIGCIVAAVAKGREMVATMTLGFIWTGIVVKGIFVLVTRHWPEQAFLLHFLVDQFGSSCLIVMGGVIVRESRSAISRRRPSRV